MVGGRLQIPPTMVWASIKRQSTGHLIPQWIDEHPIGLLSGPRLILALDMWEHAFIDYPTSEKKKYVEALFENLIRIKVEARFGKMETTANRSILSPS